jgi:hypothetical protein
VLAVLNGALPMLQGELLAGLHRVQSMTARAARLLTQLGQVGAALQVALGACRCWTVLQVSRCNR